MSVIDPEEFLREFPTLEEGLWAMLEEWEENEGDGPGVLGAVKGVMGVPGGESSMDSRVQDGGEGKDR